MTSWGWKWFAGQLLFLTIVGGLGFALGIMIRIHKDGRETTIEYKGDPQTTVDLKGDPQTTIEVTEFRQMSKTRVTTGGSLPPWMKPPGPPWTGPVGPPWKTPPVAPPQATPAGPEKKKEPTTAVDDSELRCWLRCKAPAAIRAGSWRR